MGCIIVKGGRSLQGRVRIHGAKNAALPILAATLLLEGEAKLEDVPALQDVATMCQVLRELGTSIVLDEAGRCVVSRHHVQVWEAPYELVRRMRASILVMGPLLARHHRARISLPGGCAIGSRPIDLHLKGFAAMGARITMGHGQVEAEIPQLQGAEIHLDFPSVGATENLMMAATLAKGKTVIFNAAREPEVVDLANFLNAAGAKIRGAGTDIIRIEGVQHLTGLNYRIIPDRIEAGTYLLAGAITRGEVTVENVIPLHLEPLLAKLREVGAEVTVKRDTIRVKAQDPLQAVNITTMPYPGFPTDLQPLFMALLATCQGVSLVTENIFEDRFHHVDELNRMGAEIRLQGKVAMVKGVPRLMGAPVTATDLRAGAALVLAGLWAEGVTEIRQVHHLDRGYVQLEGTLASLGAEIRRENGEKPTPHTPVVWGSVLPHTI